MSDEGRLHNDWPARLGRAMLFGAWVSGLTALGLFFHHRLERDHNPNPHPVTLQGSDGLVEVVLWRNRAGHYVASGRINGEPVRFLVDTGATEVTLSLTLARRLGLRLGPERTSRTANGITRTWPTQLARVELGGLVAHDVRASVLPHMLDDEVLLGMSVLKSLELIQRGETLTLRGHRL
ncbi:MAG: retropepsin-like aspartic protease family protein [Thermochromatium sp.]